MEKFEDKIIREYDVYLNSLRHIYELGINRSGYYNSVKKSSPKEIDEFVTEEMNSIHKGRVNEVVNSLLSNNFGLDRVRDMKTFIEYPDFRVRTYIENVAYIYSHNQSLEKCMIISPIYELNLCKNSDPSKIVRIRRLQVSPDINVFNIKEDIVNPNMIESGVKLVSKKFVDMFKSNPSKNDLIAIRNMIIKYVVENVNPEIFSNMDEFNKDSMVSYNYGCTKREICDSYDVSWMDTYKSVSNVNTPWIYRDLDYFDNRDMVLTADEPIIVPLEYQRVKK